MKTRTLLTILLLVALPLTGCVENMRDLKDRMGTEDPSLESAGADLENATDIETNNTTLLQPPVARIGVFAQNGALVYKANFQADNQTDPVFVAENSEITLIASDSETLEPGAELVEFMWMVAGEHIMGRQVTAAVGEPGFYPVSLTVTDSNNMTDEQTLVLAVAPQPFEVATTVTTTAVAGADGEGVTGTAEHDVTDVIDDKKHKIQSIKFATRGGLGCDTILEIILPDGSSTGAQDTGSDETMTLGESDPGTYTINVSGFACAAPTGVDVDVTVTYVEIVEGLGEGDGHGGHAH